MIRGERERVQITFNFRQTLGNAGRIYVGRTMCVYYTSPLYPVTGATRVVYITHMAGEKKNFHFTEKSITVWLCLAFSFFNMRAVQCASAACIIRFFFFVQFPRALVVMLFTSCWLAVFVWRADFYLPFTLLFFLFEWELPECHWPTFSPDWRGAGWMSLVLTPRNLKFSRIASFLNFLSGHVREWELE
jgi:hypothetical protein